MKIPQKLDYALRAMVQLALRHDQSILSRMDELAEAEAIPNQFLAQILSELRKAGLIESRRGKKGGYVLGRPPATITLYDIIVAIEGGEFLQHDATQKGSSAYVVRNVWITINDMLKRETQKKTLQQLADKTQTPMFFI